MAARRDPGRTARNGARALVAALGLAALVAAPVVAHEGRELGGFELEVGLVGEPVYVGEESGLELVVTKDGTPVDGLQSSIAVEVQHGSSRRALELEPAGGGAPGYVAPFIPTVAGPYTFHLEGSIDGMPIDETFTSSPTTFDEVREAASGQFPIALATAAELSAEARTGAEAARLVPVALLLGAAGLVAGLVGIGVALARRRPRES